ncbi:MAG: flavin reductase family protein [Candidatus Fonsibacter sp.]
MSSGNYKKILSKFATGVAVVLNKTSMNEYAALTINSFCSISIKPKLISWSLDKNSKTYKKFINKKKFLIFFLNSNQKKTSVFFSKNGLVNKNINQVRDLFKNNLASIYCKLYKKYSLGDHDLFICKVIYYTKTKKKLPLIYFDSKYKN